MITDHTQPGRVLDHTPAAMLRRMGDGSARAPRKVVPSCDKRRVDARSLRSGDGLMGLPILRNGQ